MYYEKTDVNVQGMWQRLDMDDQLRFIVNQFDRFGIDYWIDSGSLLGLVRDGKLMDWDYDLDVGIWFDQMPKIPDFVSAFKEQSYRPRFCFYKNVCVKVKLTRNPGDRFVDINVFRREGGYAWTIQLIESWEGRSYLERFFLKKIFAYYRKKEESHYEKYPHNTMIRGSWWIPSFYFEATDVMEIDGMKIRIPSKVQEYLEKRYGEWKTPNPNWVFTRDDGLLLHEVPAEVFNKYFNN